MLQLIHIKKDYYIDRKPFTALTDISLTFPDKGFVSVLGPSGCGKTTLLNIIGGLDHYTEGDLVIDGKTTKEFKDADWDAFRNEKVGFVFQTYNLIPHMNVLANVEVSLMLNGVGAFSRKKRALEALKSVGVDSEAHKKPNQLSGGQMQRVAMARALVNNPKIVLADEPTGALDSVTSVQVMEILKEVAKDRLVILVTHNRELAKKYSDRIIEMRDGAITSDSAPINDVAPNITGKDVNKRTAMSFPTAIKSATSNILTKKGRTILTAVASSFGIIGVAMVLAVNYGFSNYIDQVETSLATSVPISIYPVSVTVTHDQSQSSSSEFPTDQNVVVYSSGSTSTSVHYNNITGSYVNEVLNPLEADKLATVTYNYNNLSFNIITESGDTGGYFSVPQYQDANLTGSLLSSVLFPTTIFHELPKSEDGVLKNYNIIDGRYPEQPDELLLILDKYNRIDYYSLVSLGILNNDSTENSEIGQTGKGPLGSFSFDSVVYNGEGDQLYKKFIAFKNSSFYRVSEGENTNHKEDCWGVSDLSLDPDTMKVTLTKSDTDGDGNSLQKTLTGFPRVNNDSDGYQSMYDNFGNYSGKELKIVGVLRQKPDSYMDTMPASVGYLESLTKEMHDDSETADGIKLAKAAADNWYIARTGDPTTDGATLLERSLSNIALNLSKATSSDAGGLNANDIANLSSALSYAYPFVYDSKLGTGVEKAKSYAKYFAECQSVSSDFQQAKVQTFFDSLFSMVSGDSSSEANALGAAEEFLRVFTDPGFYSTDQAVDNEYGIRLIDLIAYCNRYSLISSISITPTNLASKTEIKQRMDKYNTEHPEETIKYEDYMSMFTDTLATFIKIISIVLIVFASISLVVSSVMTGIITYTSVLERTKEIGLLRACGARKKDVGRLFEAECFIVGLIAGLIGIGFTYLACLPIDQAIYNNYAIPNIALLNPLHALALLGLSIALAFLSGLIPARIAAKKDPVIALRTE